MRQRMKALQLAINYGMGVPSLARGLNRHPLIASAIIERHRRIYPRFWEWRETEVTAAMLDREIETVFGWPLRISTSPNKRTLYNFPMQGNGAEMLRLAAWRLCEAGIVPSMLVHDGILLEVDNEEQIEHAIEIMRAAGRDVCDGFEIGVDDRSEAGWRCPLSRQAAGGEADVGDDHGRAGSRRRLTEEGMKMSGVRYVISHGRRIAVETLETPAPVKRRKKAEPFAIVPLDLAAAMTEATNTRQALVCILLLYAAWKAKGKPFAFTNALLRQAKINRRVKYRALNALETAGLIKVDWHAGRSPIITLKGRIPST